MDRAAKRATALTDRLLTFSRKREDTLSELDLNEAVDGLRGMLEPLVRGSAHLEFDLTEQPLPVVVDLGQLEQVIVNLVVNARDASRELGTIRIVTGVSAGDGSRGCIRVEDDGIGMDETTRSRIFEPFFTTKAEGEGTGLGLANVHDIVRGAGGQIRVASEPGSGTQFTVELPLVSVELPLAAA